MIHGEPAYIPTEVVAMSPALAYALLAQAWDEGVKAMMRAVSEEQSVSFIAPNNPYRLEDE